MATEGAAAGGPLLLGHRGARHYVPENTIAAFDLALEHGCDGFEFDVRLTADRRAVVCHDPRLAGLEVAASTHAALSLAAPALPLLDAVLEQFRTRAFLYLELKVAGAEDVTLQLLRRLPPQHGFLVASFLEEVLRALRARDAGVPLGFICGGKLELARWADLPIDYVMPNRRLISRPLVEELHAAGKRVMAWTVNSEREMLRFADLGVDGLVSDDTVRLSRAFGRQRR